MAFLTGPRQVGKTTACRRLGDVYLNWDNEDHRKLILRGPGAVASHSGLDHVSGKLVTVVFDELHKYRRWKLFLKGLFDTYEERVRIFVTGSSRLDVYRRGGDSLTGSYFLFRMHPLSVAELVQVQRSSSPLQVPRLIPDRDWQAAAGCPSSAPCTMGSLSVLGTDKQQREVDFLVVRDGEPWYLIEAKHGEASLSPSLSLFQRQIGCPHAFQVDMHGAYVDEDCFSHRQPIVVPALTLFSQLV